MRILLDECVDFGICTFLQQRGFDVSHVAKTQWKGMSNGELRKHAWGEFDLFVSTDGDFQDPQAHPPLPTTGVICVDVIPPVAREIIPALEHFMKEVSLDSVIGKHVIVHKDDFLIQ